MKQFVKKVLALALVVGAVNVRAADDITTATTSITTGVSGIAAMVGSLAAIGAGVVIYKKIKGYFSKTS